MYNSDQTHPFAGFQANNSAQIPWGEIFSRHEAVLNSHLEILDAVKGQIQPNEEAFRTISSMVTKTIQAINQSKIARKQMLNRKASRPTFNTPSPFSSTAKTNAQASSNTPQSTDMEANGGKKRSRIAEADNMAPQYQPPTPEDEDRAPKRRRNPVEENGRRGSNTPSGPAETEDISAEVQRRLRIKEEKRRKRENAKLEKRKRESLLSNEGVSLAESMHKKKRARRTSSDLKRDRRTLEETEEGSETKRMKRGRNGC